MSDPTAQRMPDPTAQRMPDPTAQRLLDATAHMGGPVLVLDRAVLACRLDDLWGRSVGTPMRVDLSAAGPAAVREEILGHRSGLFRSAATTSVDEAIALARSGVEDVLVTEPSMDAAALTQVLTDRVLSGRVTLTVDRPEHLALLRGRATVPPRVCLAVDVGPIARRGRLRDPREVAGFARRARRLGCRPMSLLLEDAAAERIPPAPGVRGWVRSRVLGASALRRRAALDAFVDAVGAPEFVCAPGGHGFAEAAADPAVTQVLVGADDLAPLALITTVTRAGDRRGGIGERVAAIPAPATTGLPVLVV